MASRACIDSGTIIFLAECADGLGRNDFLKWFEAGTSAKLAEALCEKYQVNGQTAWSLLRKAERFNVFLVSSLSHDVVEKLRFEKLSDISLEISDAESGYIIPNGAKFKIDEAIH